MPLTGWKARQYHRPRPLGQQRRSETCVVARKDSCHSTEWADGVSGLPSRPGRVGAPGLCESSLLLLALGALVGMVLPAQLPGFATLRVLLWKPWRGSQTQWLRVGPVGSAICPRSGWQIPQPPHSLQLIAFTSAIHRRRTGRWMSSRMGHLGPDTLRSPPLWGPVSCSLCLQVLPSHQDCWGPSLNPNLFSLPLCTASVTKAPSPQLEKQPPGRHLWLLQGHPAEGLPAPRLSSFSLSRSASHGAEAASAPRLLLPVPALV